MTEEAMMAAALRAELQIAPKVDLDQLAGQLSLTIVEVESKSFEGALLRSSRAFSGRILVRKGQVDGCDHDLVGGNRGAPASAGQNLLRQGHRQGISMWHT